MSTKDLNLFASGNGGEIAILNGDLLLTEQLYQQIYLCLFGGNLEASTTGNELPGEPRLDWWANSLFFLNNPPKQFNSFTEKALRDNPLSSNGRTKILQAVEADLQNFKSVANISVNVVILNTNQVQLSISISQPQNQQDKILQFIWDNAKKELIIDVTI